MGDRFAARNRSCILSSLSNSNLDYSNIEISFLNRRYMFVFHSASAPSADRIKGFHRQSQQQRKGLRPPSAAEPVSGYFVALVVTSLI